MRSCFIDTGRGGVIAREIVASCLQAPPAFCTEAKVAKGGGLFAGHYGIMFSLTLRLLSVILCTVITSYHSNSVGVTQYRCVTNSNFDLIGGFSSAYSSAQAIV